MLVISPTDTDRRDELLSFNAWNRKTQQVMDLAR